MKSRALRKTVLFFTLLLLVGGGFFAVRLADHSLAARGAQRLPCPDADYVWASDHEILTFASSDAPASSANRFGIVGVTLDARITDIKHGSYRTLSEFNSLFPYYQPRNLPQWQVSPDGAWLLCGLEKDIPHDTRDSWYIWPLKSADSQWLTRCATYRKINWYEDNCSTTLWEPDSRHVLSLSNLSSYVAYLGDISRPELEPSPFPLPHNDGTPLGVTPDNRLVWTSFWKPSPNPNAWQPENPNPNSADLFHQGLAPNAPQKRKATIIFPKGDKIVDVSLSPKGERLAWTVGSIHHSPLEPFMQKHLQRWAAAFAPRAIVSIYISKTDGSGLYLLGSEDVPINTPEQKVRSVLWLPDGKRLSYRYKLGIFVAEVPER